MGLCWTDNPVSPLMDWLEPCFKSGTELCCQFHGNTGVFLHYTEKFSVSVVSSWWPCLCPQSLCDNLMLITNAVVCRALNVTSRSEGSIPSATLSLPGSLGLPSGSGEHLASHNETTPDKGRLVNRASPSAAANDLSYDSLMVSITNSHDITLLAHYAICEGHRVFLRIRRVTLWRKVSEIY